MTPERRNTILLSFTRMRKGKRKYKSFIKKEMKNVGREVTLMTQFLMSKSAITRIQAVIIVAIIVVAAAVGGYFLITQKPSGKTLRIFEWGGYEDPDLWNVGDSAFRKLYPDVNLEFSFFIDEAEALSKLKLGFRPDIVHPCGGSIQRWYDAGVLEPLDTSLISNWQNMSDKFITYAEEEETPVEGEVYFAPLDWGYTTLLYRPDLLEQLGIPKKDPVTGEENWDTYRLLYREDPKLAGKIMVMDSAVEVTPTAALAAGVPVDHMWDMNETEMAMTREKLLYQKLNLLRGYWTVPTQILSAMASGEIVAANIWGESYVTLKSQGVNVTFSFPEEGIISWICGFSIVDGLKARDPELYEIAHAFINAWMDPQAGANLIDLYAYGHSNKYAHTLAQRTDTIELLHFDDPAYLEQTVLWQYTPNEADWIAMWDEVKADPPREVVYEWYDFFDVPDPGTGKLGEWYDVRGDHGIVRDEYPMVFWNEPSERLGDIWFYTLARLKVTGTALTELNMSDNPKPQFVPLFAPDADSGGNVALSFYLQYLTTEEWEATDGWIVKWTGTIELDKAAAKRVLNITDANYADISGWWTANKDDVESDWRDWLVEEARVTHDIYNMYGGLYSPSSVSLNCSKVGDLVVLDVEVVDWGGEVLWARWLRDSFMPVEYYYEDMYFNATISPYHANLTLDTGVSYALYALDYGEDGTAWAFEAVLGDILASSPAHNVSDFDLYVDPDTGEYWTDPYESYGPGTKWYGEADLTWTYTATGWNLKEGEQLILKFPNGNPIPAYLHGGDLHYGSPFCENVTEMWGSSLDYVYMDTIEWNGFETSGPSSISYDLTENIANYTGPLDLSGDDWWGLPKDWRELPKDDWWGVLEYGVPYIELYYTLTTQIVINSVTLSQTSATAGDSVSINATVTNEGYETENFTVTAYYNTTAIETKTVTSLPAGDNTTLTFTWDTTNVAAGNYTVKVKAEFSSYTKESMVTVTSQPPLITIEIIIAIAAIVIIIIVAIGYVLTRKKETP